MVKWLVAFLLLASPLKAQVFYGDTAWYREGRTESRGWFFLDTTQTIGWYKWDAKKPWVEEMPRSLMLHDLWFRTASCQGMWTTEREFNKYRFFLVNREIFGGKGPLQIAYVGYHLQDSLAIYIARPRRFDPLVLMHEMTHALMFLRGEKAGHPYNRYGPFGCGLSYVTR